MWTNGNNFKPSMSNLLVFNNETDCYNTAKFLNTGVIVNFNVMSNIVLLLW